MKLLPKKFAAITEYPAPSTPDELRRFLDMINFNNRFIPNAIQDHEATVSGHGYKVQKASRV